MKGKEKSVPPPAADAQDGYIRYAAEVLLPLLAELNGELTGVKTSTIQGDNKYVHQSRVASRRIRSALPLLESCFEQKAYRFWMRSVRDITRSLGQARDLDVQIEFLTIFIEAHTAHDTSIPLFANSLQDTISIESETASLQTLEFFTQPLLKDAALDPENLPDKIREWLRERKRASIEIEQQDHVPHVCVQTLSLLKQPQAYNRPGLECLLLRLQQHREEIQPDVADAVVIFEQSKTLSMMQHYLLSHLTKHQNTPYPDRIYTDAMSSILYLIQNLCWYAPAVPDARKKNMHHEMRIAAKRLRYTLEACNKLYDDTLSSDIKTVKTLQALLGDLHDCDVWIDLLPQFLDSEKERAQNYFGNDTFFSLIRPGILFLLDDRTKERERIHAELVQYWEKLVHDEFFALLTEKVRKESVASHSSSNETKQGEIHSEAKKRHEKHLKKSIRQPDVVSTASMLHDDTVVALIGDVHANLPALNAVLADAKKRGATMILNAGDLVGYGPYPEEVVDALHSSRVISIIGNYDRSLFTQWWLSEERQPLAYDQDWDADPEDTFMLRLKREVSKWTYDRLSSGSREYLANLPEYMRKTLFGRSLLLVHGSPSSMTEYITSETPKTRLSEIAASSNADIIVAGHAHMPCVREVDKVLFINTGSVGRSEDGDPRACYALLSCGDEKNLVVEHIRVSYDINETISKMEQYELPERYIRAIREGRSPDLLPD